MGLTALAIGVGVGAAAGLASTAVGVYSMNSANDLAEEQNNLTQANMRAQAEENAKAVAKAEAIEKNAKNATVAEAKNPDLETAIDLSKRKKGVQSTFTAGTGAGSGMMKGTTLSPLGGDEDA